MDAPPDDVLLRFGAALTLVGAAAWLVGTVLTAAAVAARWRHAQFAAR
jgi:hypothetical protein